jgi:uncharacterized damage-inducible protein DinB
MRKTMMTQTELVELFKDALATFKAFDNLTVKNSGSDQDGFPMSVWQILNHLLSWQAYQISSIKGQTPEKHISEIDTWLNEKAASSEEVLQVAVTRFKKQLEFVQTEIYQLPATGEALKGKLKIFQEIALHLSFHLGEVVLMRRVNGSYPMPGQMKEFLQT